MKEIIGLKNKFIDYIMIEKGFSPHTVKAYKTDLEGFCDFLENEGPEKINDISENTLRSYMFCLRTLQYDFSSIERKLATLKSFFSFLVKIEQILISPAKNVTFPKKKQGLPVFLSQNEMTELLSARIAEDLKLSHRDIAIVELFYGSGIRLFELHKLDIGSIDHDNKILKVHGKGNKKRIVPINETCLERVDLYIKKERELVKPKHDNAIFLSRNGKRLCQRHIAKIVKRTSTLVLGRSDVSPHSLRHSYATHLLENGAEIKLISKMLGHSSINTTQKYTHLNIKKIMNVYLNSHPHARQK